MTAKSTVFCRFKPTPPLFGAAILACDRRTDRQTHDDSIYCACIVSRGRNESVSQAVFVPYARPQFWADLDQIWHVASLYHAVGHGLVSERCSRPQARASRALYITPLKWLASSVGELVSSRHMKKSSRAQWINDFWPISRYVSQTVQDSDIVTMELQ